MGIIYITTNLINGKHYIGQTIQTLKERKRGHLKEAKKEIKKYPFYRAINKYGWDNFKWISFFCPEEDLDWQETLLIKELNTLSPNGYNLDSGGHKNKRHSMETKIKMSKNSTKYWLNKKMPKEITDKMSKSHKGKGVGINNPMYGKGKELSYWYGKSIPNEIRYKISQTRIKNKIGSGENNPSSILTKEQVVEIKNKLNKKLYSQKELAQMYMISKSTISAIYKDEIWKDIKIGGN